MFLKEYQGKELFRKEGITTPEGVFLEKNTKDFDKKLSKLINKRSDFVIKPQVSFGGRGKKGMILFSKKDTLFENISNVINEYDLLVEEKVDFEKLYYLSYFLDTSSKKEVLIFSQEGGVDIEDVSSKNPEKIKKLFLLPKRKKYFYVFYDFFRKFVDTSEAIELSRLSLKLYNLSVKYSSTLVEINPLAKTREGFIALDSKIIIDDNAIMVDKNLYEFLDNFLTPEQKKSLSQEFSFVALDGNIGVIGNGAGLVMATLDLINYFGGKPANFLDLGGGASKERVKKALSFLLSNKKDLDVILLNIFGGITRCDEIAKGLVEFLEENKDLTVVVRLTGTNEEEGKRILEENGIFAYDNAEDAIKKAVEISKR